MSSKQKNTHIEENATPGKGVRGRWRLRFCVAAFFLLYLAIESVYVTRLPMVMDEFLGAQRVLRLQEEVPYRDFRPLKTVMGYYIQLPMLSLSSDPWERLLLIRSQNVIICAFVIGILSLFLMGDFSAGAVLAALALLIPMSTFLERSLALRIDTLMGLCGLVSLFFMMRGRIVWSGIFCACAFLITQKSVYYVLAGSGAMGAWLLVDRSRKAWRDFLIFHLAMLLTLTAYLLFWSAFAPLSKMVQDIFFQEQHRALAFRDRYGGFIHQFWFQTLSRNPLFYGFGLGALALAAARCLGRGVRRDFWMLLVYVGAFAWIPFEHHSYLSGELWLMLGVGILVFLLFFFNRGRSIILDWPLLLVVATGVGYLQLWSYGLVILGLGALWPVAVETKRGPAPRETWILLVFETVLSILCVLHKGAWTYFFLTLIPSVFVLHVYLFHQIFSLPSSPLAIRSRTAVLTLLILLGVLLPLSRLSVTLERDSGFQRHMVELGYFLLKEGETYQDGSDILYSIPQAQEDLRLISMVDKKRLRSAPSDELDRIVQDLEEKPIKLIILTYRLENLPTRLSQHFFDNFAPLWGNIWIYAPQISSAENQFKIKFTGSYRVETVEGTQLSIDGKPLTHESVLELKKGSHLCESAEDFRLQFLPEGLEQVADENYFEPRAFFDRPYSF